MWPSGSADKVFPSRVQKPRDLATLDVTALVGDTGLRTPSVFQI